MSTQTIIRVVFVVACLMMGLIWANFFIESAYKDMPEPPITWPWKLLGAAGGAGVAFAVLYGLKFVTQSVFERIFPAVIAIVLAIVVGVGLSQYVFFWLGESVDQSAKIFLTTTLVLLFGFVGISVGLTRASNWEQLLREVHRRREERVFPKLVDTSVLIDGRIADICDSGFIDGQLLIPRFVLRELQNIADSSDVLRRARGRRGLDIIKRLQEPVSKIKVEVIEDDPVDVDEVDAKLVRLAQEFKSKVLTNDFNLNKVAQIEGVDVLNINDLANALKPAVLPDEEMQVRVIKEGKEAYQGVGYLDDGTMVVVDGGREHVGRDVSVVVTSVLQTAAGRMIFTRLQSVLS